MSTHIIINGTIPRIRYVSDGSLTTYDFPFAIFQNTDLKVYFNSTLQAANTYVVTGAGNSTGGQVTFATAPESGVIITMTRELNIERTTDFQEGGALRADALNYELDYQIACQQQIADNLNRSMVLPPYAAGTEVNLTLPVPAAGKAIVWNSSGTNLENSTVEVNALEATLRSYKESAESASTSATTQANLAATSAAAAGEQATAALTSATTAAEQAAIATAKATEVSGALSTKANVEMNNLTSAGKAVITNLGIPDYSAVVSKSWNTQYTADKDGFVVAYAVSDNTTGSATLTVSGVGFVFGSTTTGNVRDSFGAFVAKGEKYKGTNGTSANIKFYPLKGA